MVVLLAETTMLMLILHVFEKIGRASFVVDELRRCSLHSLPHHEQRSLVIKEGLNVIISSSFRCWTQSRAVLVMDPCRGL